MSTNLVYINNITTRNFVKGENHIVFYIIVCLYEDSPI